MTIHLAVEDAGMALLQSVKKLKACTPSDIGVPYRDYCDPLRDWKHVYSYDPLADIQSTIGFRQGCESAGRQ